MMDLIPLIKKEMVRNNKISEIDILSRPGRASDDRLEKVITPDEAIGMLRFPKEENSSGLYPRQRSYDRFICTMAEMIEKYADR